MNDTTQSQTITPKNLYRRKIGMFILGGVLCTLGLIWLIYWLLISQFKEYTNDAYVSGNMVQLMPQISGTVLSIAADDTQMVKAGQVLITLDATDYAIGLEHAKASLAQTVRQVRQYFENVEQAEQKVKLDRANLQKAQLDLKRRAQLVGNRAISREEMHHFEIATQEAEAAYQVSLHQWTAARALVANSDLYSHPLVETAKSNLKSAFINFQRTKIVSPITGYISKRSIQLGQQVSPRTPMMAIVPLNDTWIDANYKEPQLYYIRVGQPATVYADAYPGVIYHGKVVGLNAGTGSAFSLLPPQNATGNWIKIVQRLPVRIEIHADDLRKNPLQLGLSVQVTINTHDRKGSRMLLADAHPYHFATNVYQQQLADVDKLIEQILKQNTPDLTLPKSTLNGE